jgi:hypothetical protein
MYRQITLGKFKTSFTFRHKWDEINKTSYRMDFRTYELGLWFRKDRIVGAKDFKTPKKWKLNMVNDYNIGINLIVFKFWISFNYGGAQF